jgi:hypothetical protein
VQKAVQQADVIFYSVNPGGPSIKLNQIAMRAERGWKQSPKPLEARRSFLIQIRISKECFGKSRQNCAVSICCNTTRMLKLRPGQFRRITVAVPARNDVRVRARQGYYPKKQD